MRSAFSLAAAELLVVLAACEQQADRSTYAAIDQARLLAADEEPQNWLSYGRTYAEQRYSPLAQITAENVGRLGLAWSYEFRDSRGVEATPLIVDGVMYVTSAWSVVYALDAKTGDELWVYDPLVPRERGALACCDVVNRGVAVWRGKVYVGTLDGRLIAIDAATGSKLWEQVTVDQSKPYTITGAPRAARGLIYIGNGGAEFGVRGYVSAFDAESGILRWRFYSTPNPKGPDRAASDSVRERALATWNRHEGAWLTSGGGGTVWDSIVYDPELNTLWVGVGNGAPWNQQVRSPASPDTNNDNLFLASVVALDPDTGQYKCHYQETPGETWDYTATQPIMLATLDFGGSMRKVLLHAPKNGFFYVLDRADCSLISAKAIVPVNWAQGIDMTTGRPIENAAARYRADTYTVFPGPFGAHNWHPMAFSAQTQLVYIPAQHIDFQYSHDPAFTYRGGRFNTGIIFPALPRDPAVIEQIRRSTKGFLLAWDPVAQREVWRAPHATAWNGGALATAGGLVFQGTADGLVVAYDARIGRELWRYNNQGATLGGPATYSIEGQQYIATLAGYGSIFFLINGFVAQGANLPSRVNVFRLDGNARLPPLDLKRAEMPTPPAIKALPETVAHGGALYDRYCFMCHGAGAISGGVIPDLRYSSVLQDSGQWRAAIRGERASGGMPDYTQSLSDLDAEALRAYVAAQVEATKELAPPTVSLPTPE
jgi:PQQ-dependent dehydrogenase (methanol/ethanol family)